MNTKTLSNHALDVIDQYLNFRVGTGVCSIPYFNNKTVRARAALRVNIGKGSPKEIYEEIQGFILKNHVGSETLNSESLKKLLADQNIGIDCSGFAYYILNAESSQTKHGLLDKHMHFVYCKGILGKLRAKLRPIENCDVATFAHDKNSKIINIKEIQPGDIITMTGSVSEEDERDHVLVIHQVEYQNFVAIKIHYSHAVAYPEDGVYGTGIKQGTIEIIKPEANITEQIWKENEKTGLDNRMFVRATKSKIEIRRIR